MATSVSTSYEVVPVLGRELDEKPYATAIWEEISAWLAFLPLLFISVGGQIQTASGPVAFRITAMAQDSMGRQIARLGCMLLILFLVSTRIREVLMVCKRSKLLLLLPGIALLSVLWSQSRGHTVIDALNLLITTLFAIYLYVRYPGERLIAFLHFAAFVSLLLCVLSVTVFRNVGIDAYQQSAWRGIFGQRNNCAAVCTLFLALGLHMRVRDLVEQLMRASVIFLSLVFIVMSGSRAGWIVAVLALVLTYSLRFIIRLPSLDRLLFLMAMLIPTIVLGLFIFNNFTQILDAMDKDPTMTQRTVIWAQVIPSILKHPFTGYGYSAFWMGLSGESMQAVLVTGWMEAQAQDGYLDVLLQLGIFGLIPMIMLFLRAGVNAVSAVERRMLNSAVLFAIVLLPLILVENIGESSLLLPLCIPWFYAITAFLILARPDRDEREY